ncbi:MAG: hypothetical protein ACK5VL_09140, partial [Brevundimonas sp.]
MHRRLKAGRARARRKLFDDIEGDRDGSRLRSLPRETTPCPTQRPAPDTKSCMAFGPGLSDLCDKGFE